MREDRLALGSRVGQFKSIQKLWEWAKENLTIEEINDKFLLGTENAGKTVWHLAAMGDNLDILQNYGSWLKRT